MLSFSSTLLIFHSKRGSSASHETVRPFYANCFDTDLISRFRARLNGSDWVNEVKS